MRNENSHCNLSAINDPGSEKRGYFVIEKLEAIKHANPKIKPRPASLQHFEIIIVLSGAGSLYIDSKELPVYPPVMCLMTPGQTLNYDLTDGCEGYRLTFSRDYLYLAFAYMAKAAWQGVRYAGEKNSMIMLDPELEVALDELIVLMQKELSSGSLLRSEMLSTFLSILLIHFSGKIPDASPASMESRENELASRFLHLVKIHFATIKQVIDYANRINVSPNYLNYVVKKITGNPASYHIHQQIIAEAKRKIMNDNGTMKDIASFLGFDDPGHFSKFFKKYGGVNFSVFKKSRPLFFQNY